MGTNVAYAHLWPVVFFFHFSTSSYIIIHVRMFNLFICCHKIAKPQQRPPTYMCSTATIIIIIIIIVFVFAVITTSHVHVLLVADDHGSLYRSFPYFSLFISCCCCCCRCCCCCCGGARGFTYKSPTPAKLFAGSPQSPCYNHFTSQSLGHGVQMSMLCLMPMKRYIFWW